MEAGEAKPAPEGCVVRTGMLTLLYAQPKPFDAHFAQLPDEKEYEVLEVSHYNHGGLTTMNFYKVHDAEMDVTGWVQQIQLDFTNPKCFE